MGTELSLSHRDDGLIALPSNGRDQEKIRQKLVKTFGTCNFKIETTRIFVYKER